MRYRYVFRRAWQEASRHRELWWYGLLASLVTPFCFDPSSQLLAPVYPWLDRFVAGPSFLSTTAILASGTVLLGLAVQLCGVVGRLALIDTFQRQDGGEISTHRMSWQRLTKRGSRALGVTLLLGLPVWALAFVSWLPFLVPVVSANLDMGAGRRGLVREGSGECARGGLRSGDGHVPASSRLICLLPCSPVQPGLRP